ncbi:metal-dependent hydrolase [Brevibacillus dissolubilis]|uniref:metal-dependent hydrolase n=1 Tax=Brevibacillus dissolubilis TaxID=1844116 RepID=UPI001116DA0C|nr:metal-dependent hydrolase [Brevibacillus dissolubilis]
MDTGSHLLFGCSLAGLACVDPVVAQNPELVTAVAMCTLIGSNAPDLDTVVRVKGYASYVRYHRGITHSIPAWFIWPAVIALPIAFFMHLESYIWTLYLWAFLAVVFHIFLDALNTYGVQCYRPVTKKWIHYDILAIFEPLLFVLHLAGVVLWLSGVWEAGAIFTTIYLATFAYIGMRIWQHRLVVKRVEQHLGDVIKGTCQVQPTFHWFRWSFVAEGEDCYYTGEVANQQVLVRDSYGKTSSDPIVYATLQTDGVRAFLHIAQLIHVTYKELHDGYEVIWSDVRFWHNRKLPFGVDVRLDKNLRVVKCSFGWRKKAWEAPYV